MSDLDVIRERVLKAAGSPPITRSWKIDAITIGSLEVGLVTMFVVIAAWGFKAPVELRWVSATLLLATMLAGCAIAVVPRHRPSRLLFSLLAVVAMGTVVVSRGVVWDPLEGVVCALLEVGLALAPCSVTFVLLRRFAYRPWESLIGGVAAGVTGMLALELTCPHGQASHAVVFHLAPCVVIAALFVVVRARAKSRTFVP